MYQYTWYVYIHLSIHSVYLVSDLEGSDNGDPITGLFIVLAVSHGLLAVLKKCFLKDD
jgi:hypothetical protein